MAGTGYAFTRQGLLTSVSVFVNVLFAGMVTLGVWAPLCGSLEPILTGTGVDYIDCLVMTFLFCVTLGALRVGTILLAPAEPEYHALAAQIGSFLLGMATGYLVSGFLLCVLQTL